MRALVGVRGRLSGQGQGQGWVEREHARLVLLAVAPRHDHLAAVARRHLAQAPEQRPVVVRAIDEAEQHRQAGRRVRCEVAARQLGEERERSARRPRAWLGLGLGLGLG